MKPGVKTVNTEQLESSLTNHSPDAAQLVDIEAVRVEAKSFGRAILNHCPDSREKSIAITNLEQACMWATKSIILGKKS